MFLFLGSFVPAIYPSFPFKILSLSKWCRQLLACLLLLLLTSFCPFFFPPTHPPTPPNHVFKKNPLCTPPSLPSISSHSSHNYLLGLNLSLWVLCHVFWSFALNLECFRCLWSLSLALGWFASPCFVLLFASIWTCKLCGLCLLCWLLLFVTSRALVSSVVSYVISLATPKFFVQNNKFLLCFVLVFFTLFNHSASMNRWYMWSLML